MGITFALFHLAFLLAARSNSARPTNKRRASTGNPQQNEPPLKKKGRQRYAPKSRSNGYANNQNTKRRKGEQDGRKPSQTQVEENILPVVPPLTDPRGPFPTYFTCRHTYEETLIEEITRYSPDDLDVQASSSAPGLVYVEGLSSNDENESNQHVWDPVYALQSLPNCRIVESPNSIKGLARAIAEIDDFACLLATAPRGSLAIHALVPGMCKGQKDPVWQRRAHLVTEAIADIWKGQFAAARKPKKDEGGAPMIEHQELLLQVLLLSPDVAAASLSLCQSTNTLSPARWPNPNYPVGMAQVDITTQKMPSSAYRKLLEAFACGGRRPSGRDTVVDLGASPGGWAAALLLYCDTDDMDKDPDDHIHILAVDRSRLDPKLMKDPRVTFIQGDAFSFEPPKPPVDWMVSDIIAYPERIVELVDHWCRKTLADNMVITIKFQGSNPSWEYIDEAIQVAESHRYCARVKHFFNNKNEVTLMLYQETAKNESTSVTSSSLVKPISSSFYKPVVSAARQS